MLFNSFDFLIFFATVVFIFYCLPNRFKVLFLVLSSLFFYMWWDYRFVCLILASITMNFAIGKEIERSKVSLLWLRVGLSFNLLVLAFFKYFNFFAETLAQLFSVSPEHWSLKIILPIGISFYTFEGISYLVDVYQKRLIAVKDYFKFALFISFFPHLVSGPIIRPTDFFPQIENWKIPSRETFEEGFLLISVGLVKKIVFADNFALVADNYFNHLHGNGDGAGALGGVIAFSMQIFFDFSGYTDMARGLAKLLGYEFPINFARPYLARNIQDFWRRWHISLSTWLRDYLYIPLGGNRGTQVCTYRNLILTMALGGLWHGASWNFVIWGTYHGVLLAIHKKWTDIFGKSQLPGLLIPFQVFATFLLVSLGWIFFRANSFSDTKLIFSDLFFGWSNPGRFLAGGLGYALVISIIFAVLEENKNIFEKFLTLFWPWKIVSYALFFFILEIFSLTDVTIPFIYFQF